MAPRVLQGVLAALSDTCFYDICRRVSGSHIARYALLAHLSSWSLTYCMCRTLSNSTETALLLLILWAWMHRNRAMAIILSVISVYSRPTALIMLGPVVTAMLITQSSPIYFLLQCLVIGAVPLLGCIYMDVVGYSYDYVSPGDAILYIWHKLMNLQFDQLVVDVIRNVPPLRFLEVNFIENKSAIFGIKPYYWYFTEGLVTVLGLHLFVVACGLYLFILHKSFRNRISYTSKLFIALSGVYTVVMSLSPHKEFRFILPILPAVHLFVGYIVSYVNDTYKSSSNEESASHRQHCGDCMRLGSIVLSLLCGLHAIASVYLITYHQGGTESAFHYISADIETRYLELFGKYDQSAVDIHASINIYLLAPCHSFPGYSFMPTHYVRLVNDTKHMLWLPLNVSLYSPDCSPDEGLESASKKFEKSPGKFVELMSSRHECMSNVEEVGCWPDPDIVLTFDCYENSLADFFQIYNLDKVISFPHAFFIYDHDDPTFKREVSVFYRTK